MSFTQACYLSAVSSAKKVASSAVLQVIVASLFIALCAQIRFPLFFTSVPITLQTFAVMLVGARLGSKKGALSVLLYIAEAAAGLPVLTGGLFGLACCIGPHAGYLVGFVAQSYLVGKFLEQKKNMSSIKTVAILLLSSALQMGLGVLWLAHFVGLQHVMLLGFYPFVPGEAIKAFIVTMYLKSRMHKNDA